MAISKNQQAGNRGSAREKFYRSDKDCLPKYNYSNGAGQRTKSKNQWSFAIKSKKRSGFSSYI